MPRELARLPVGVHSERTENGLTPVRADLRPRPQDVCVIYSTQTVEKVPTAISRGRAACLYDRIWCSRGKEWSAHPRHSMDER